MQESKEKLHKEAAVIFWFDLGVVRRRNHLREILALATKLYLKVRWVSAAKHEPGVPQSSQMFDSKVWFKLTYM